MTLANVEHIDSPCGRLLSRFEGKRTRTGKGWLVCCPAHGDRTPSLHISETDDQRVLLRCHAGCTTEDVVQSLGIEMSELFPPRLDFAANSNGRSKPTASLTLREFAAEKKLPIERLKELGLREGDYFGGTCVEFSYPTLSGGLGRVRQRTEMGRGGFRWKGKDGQIVAYTPDRCELARRSQCAVLVEGESCALSLLISGIPAIGIPGANTTRALEAGHIEGLACLFVVQEPDEGGAVFVAGVQSRLKELGFDGPLHVMTMPAGTKDASALYMSSPEDFERKFHQLMDAAVDAAKPKPAGLHPADIVLRWQQEGPLTRVPTGIDALDELCLGGLPVPWRVMLVGAPSAGKTFFEVAMANKLARSAEVAGLCVGILAVDEEPDDITIRLAQLCGFTISEAEDRDPRVLSAMVDAMRSLRVRLYDSSQTIESAANDLAAWAAAEGRKGALFIDSIQAATCEAGLLARSPRELVEANVKAMRWAHDHHGFLCVATVEANRASYRDDDAAESTNDLAAGAESRAIEFGGKTQLMLRTPKGHPDVVWCRVVKNRRAKKGDFWLAIDRESHTLAPCENPKESPMAAEQAQHGKRAANIAKLEGDARMLLRLVIAKPNAGTKALRSAAKLAGYGWGTERIEAATDWLRQRGVDGYRIVDRSEKPGQHQWFAEPFGGDDQQPSVE